MRSRLNTPERSSRIRKDCSIPSMTLRRAGGGCSQPIWSQAARAGSFRAGTSRRSRPRSNCPSLRLRISAHYRTCRSPESASMAGGRKVVSFAATPRMSSYLFVLAVGDYDRISTVSQGVDIGVVVPGYQVETGTLCAWGCGAHARLFQRIFRRQVSVAEARQHPGAAQLLGCDGELGRRHLFRTRAAV